jgi:hypothetical protein
MKRRRVGAVWGWSVSGLRAAPGRGSAALGRYEVEWASMPAAARAGGGGHTRVPVLGPRRSPYHRGAGRRSASLARGDGGRARQGRCGASGRARVGHSDVLAGALVQGQSGAWRRPPPWPAVNSRAGPFEAAAEYEVTSSAPQRASMHACSEPQTGLGEPFRRRSGPRCTPTRGRRRVSESPFGAAAGTRMSRSTPLPKLGCARSTPHRNSHAPAAGTRMSALGAAAGTAVSLLGAPPEQP